MLSGWSSRGDNDPGRCGKSLVPMLIFRPMWKDWGFAPSLFDQAKQFWNLRNTALLLPDKKDTFVHQLCFQSCALKHIGEM